MTSAPKTNFTILIIIAVVFLIIGILISKFFLAGGLVFNGGKPLTLSPNILDLTQPVMSFSGQVDSINGDTLTVTKTNTLLPNVIPMPGASQPTEAKTQIITYKIKITDGTIINRQNIISPIRTATASAAANLAPQGPNIVKKEDIQIGDYINALTSEDLRTINSNSFTATSISLSPAQTSLQGQIIEVNDDTVTVLGMPSMVPGISNYPQSYQLKIVGDTKLTRIAGTKTTNITAAGLTINQTVNVATKQPVRLDVELEISELQVIDSIAPLAPPVIVPPASTAPSISDSPVANP